MNNPVPGILEFQHRLTREGLFQERLHPLHSQAQQGNLIIPGVFQQLRAHPCQAGVMQLLVEPVQIVQRRENLLGQRRRERFLAEACFETDQLQQPVVFGIVLPEFLVRRPFMYRLLSLGIESQAVRFTEQPVFFQHIAALSGAAQDTHQGIGAAGRGAVAVDPATVGGDQGAGPPLGVAGFQRDDRQPRTGSRNWRDESPSPRFRRSTS